MPVPQDVANGTVTEVQKKLRGLKLVHEITIATRDELFERHNVLSVFLDNYKNKGLSVPFIFDKIRKGMFDVETVQLFRRYARSQNPMDHHVVQARLENLHEEMGQKVRSTIRERRHIFSLMTSYWANSGME